ncbi:MAG: T9SS type A sorting domain-containing protein [Bacteroidetes bacterium]|nr:T9SS type A sorting domain-containing protein [Bacteroidota bacterium]
MRKFTSKSHLFLLTIGLTMLVLLSANVSFGQLFTEPFNYTASPTNGLSAQSSGAWIRLNTGDSILVESGNLTYTGFPASTGNRITYGGAGSENYRVFTNQATGTVYASFLLKVNSVSSLNTTGGYTVGFVENGSTTNYAATVWLRNNAAAGTTQYNIGINPRTTAANTAWVATPLDTGTTYLIVMSYQIVAGTTNDIVKIWINPALGGSEPAANQTATNTLTDLNGIQKILLRQDAAATTPVLVMDEMRVGVAWSEVTPSEIVGSATVTTDLTGFTGAFGGVVVGGSSSSSSYTVSGANLTSDILIHPPTGFEIRTGANPFSTSDITLTQSGGIVNSTTIDVRFTPTGTGSVSGNVVNSSTGAPDANVPVSGNGLSAQPTVQSSNVTFASVGSNSFTINFNAGNGTNRIVLVKSGSAVDANPVNGVSYTANSAFGSGTQIGTGNYVVYNGTETSVSVTGLSGSTTYYVAVLEFNGSAGSENYFLTSPATNNQLTLEQITSVVINKYQNSTPDGVELLVIQNNLDMRGMIIKDFSGSMATDGGGKFQFTTNTLWSSVPAGTLIVLRNNATAADSVADDYLVDVGLTNTSFFTNLGGTFDIATTEVVMIKTAGSDPAGVNGCIHALAGGTAGTFFTSAPTPKLIATGTSGTNFFVYANNTNSVLADYNGTDATGGATGLTFGTGNNASNTAYINSLRNITYTADGVIPAGSYSSITINGSGIVVTLGGNVTIGTLTLIDGFLELGTNDLTVNSTVGGNSSTYVRTNGTGKLKINNVGNTFIAFPIGNTSYNQVLINNAGTVDNFSINVQNSIDNPTIDNNQAVQLQWNISEDVPGGSDATLNFRWPGSAEGINVNHSLLKIGHFTGGNYVEVPSDPIVDLGGIYTISSTGGVTSFSPFIIANQGIAPVELSSFTSIVTRNTVKLNWSTISEINNSGFDIERKSVTSDWTKVSNVNGNGTSNNVHTYTYDDRNLTTGKYNYRLKQIDFNGNYKYYQLTNEVEVGIPNKYDLSQNYPNPFNPSTTINYELPKSNFVSLKIYDMMGREVANLVNQTQDAGFYSIKFDASKLSSGIYFYKIQAADFSAVKKLMLVK